MGWFGSLGVCEISFKSSFLFGGREGGGRGGVGVGGLNYKSNFKVYTAKGGKKEKRNATTTLLAMPSPAPGPVIYLYS